MEAHLSPAMKDAAGILIQEVQISYGQPDVSDAGFAVGCSQELPILDSRNLNIFLANLQVYNEASEVLILATNSTWVARPKDSAILNYCRIP